MGAKTRTGEESDPAVADADRAEHSEAVFGQTCPIETAVDVPAWRIKGYDDGVICTIAVNCVPEPPTQSARKRTSKDETW